MIIWYPISEAPFDGSKVLLTDGTFLCSGISSAAGYNRPDLQMEEELEWTHFAEYNLPVVP